jgi:hypothetical protein
MEIDEGGWQLSPEHDLREEAAAAATTAAAGSPGGTAVTEAGAGPAAAVVAPAQHEAQDKNKIAQGDHVIMDRDVFEDPEQKDEGGHERAMEEAEEKQVAVGDGGGVAAAAAALAAEREQAALVAKRQREEKDLQVRGDISLSIGYVCGVDRAVAYRRSGAGGSGLLCRLT